MSARCEDCNTPLSYCGVPGDDGNPTLDCLACIRLSHVGELDIKLQEAQVEIEYLRGAIAFIEPAYQKLIARCSEFYAENERLRAIMEQVGKQAADRATEDATKGESDALD